MIESVFWTELKKEDNIDYIDNINLFCHFFLIDFAYLT